MKSIKQGLLNLIAMVPISVMLAIVLLILFAAMIFGVVMLAR